MTTLSIDSTTSDTEYTWADTQPTFHSSNPLTEKIEAIWQARDFITDERADYATNCGSAVEASVEALQEAVNLLAEAASWMRSDEAAARILVNSACLKLLDAGNTHFAEHQSFSPVLDGIERRATGMLADVLGYDAQSEDTLMRCYVDYL